MPGMSRDGSPRRGCRHFTLAGVQLTVGLLLTPVGKCLADCQTLAGEAAPCSGLTIEKVSCFPGHSDDLLLARSPASPSPSDAKQILRFTRLPGRQLARERLQCLHARWRGAQSAEPYSSSKSIAQGHGHL